MDWELAPEEFWDLWDLARRIAAAKGSADPEAVAQEVLFKLTKLKARPNKPEAWVRRATKNQLIDHWRRGEARPQEVAETDPVPRGDAGRSTVNWLMENVPTSEGGMQKAAYSWFNSRLADVFTEEEIQLLSLVGAGVSQAEIAGEMGYKNAAVVKTTVARLRRKADALDRAELEELLNHPRAY